MAVTFSDELDLKTFINEVNGTVGVDEPAADSDEHAQWDQWFESVKKMVKDRAPEALDPVLADRCVYRLGYQLQDIRRSNDFEQRRANSAWRDSGAEAICKPHRVRRMIGAD